MTLPAFALAITMSGSITRLTRSQMIEVLGQDYIKAVRAKGVKETSVIFKHSLKNALIPVVTLAGMWYASTLGGTILIEEIFALPGLGRLIIKSIFNRDYPVVQGVVLFIAVINIFANLFIDLTYNYFNPKIQIK
jgi:peptide/nickel transport system permease protein